MRADEYTHLNVDYDTTPWTKDELHSLAWEAGKSVGWEDMDEYDAIPDKR